MADSVLLPENIEKITRRDGAPHSITEFTPSKTALLVIDMQNFYMVEGRAAYCAPAHGIVDPINRLVDAMRRFGGKVVWVRNVTNPEAFKTWSQHYGRMKEEVVNVRKRDLAKDSDGFRLWHELDCRDDDLRLNKTRYSAFIDDASNIRTTLEKHGIDTLVCCGIATNVCVEATARDAMMLNYRTLIVEDACAAGSDVAHRASLNTFYSNFGDVQTVDEFLAHLGLADAAAAE